MSCPPAASPSTTTGCRFARAAYTAAVRPAGPDPTITRSWCSGWFSGTGRTRRFLVAGNSACPAEPAGEQEDSSEHEPGGPNGQRDGEHPEQQDREQHGRGHHEERGEKAVDDGLRGVLRRDDGAVPDQHYRLLDS